MGPDRKLSENGILLLSSRQENQECFFKVGIINGTPASSFDCLTSRMTEHKLKESEEVKKLITGIVGDYI